MVVDANHAQKTHIVDSGLRCNTKTTGIGWVKTDRSISIKCDSTVIVDEQLGRIERTQHHPLGECGVIAKSEWNRC
jgi:hypothetical protein